MAAQVSIGILGCGSIAEEHARCLARIDGVAIAACADVDEARAGAFAAKFAIPRFAADAEDIFQDERIDAVYICTHNDTHHTLAARGAEAGKHLFVEKPLALTAAHCRAAGEAAVRAGVTLMTGFKLRFYPSVERARRHVPSPILTVAQMTDTRWEDDFWANDPVRGGGNVFSQGCHAVDLICHLNGSDPESIFAFGGNFLHPSLPIVDTLTAAIRFPGGAVASVAIGDSGASPVLSKFSFQIADGSRTAHLHDRLKSVTLTDGTLQETFREKEEEGMMRENEAFIRAIREGTPAPVGWREGLRATLILEEAVESIRTGRSRNIRVE